MTRTYSVQGEELDVLNEMALSGHAILLGMAVAEKYIHCQNIKLGFMVVKYSEVDIWEVLVSLQIQELGSELTAPLEDEADADLARCKLTLALGGLTIS